MRLGSEQKYFGEDLTIVDILYYTEISTITFLSGKQIIPVNSNIEHWYTKTMQRPEIQELDTAFRNTMEDF